MFLFAAGSLRSGLGGIAELSRQVFQTLLAMDKEGLIRLQVHVLEDSAPSVDDGLIDRESTSCIRWYSGSRWKFVLGVARITSAIKMFDHVGLARIQSYLPFRSQQYVLLIHSIEIWRSERNDYAQTARGASLLIANSEFTARKSLERYSDLPPIEVCLPGKDPTGIVSHDRPESLVWPGEHSMLIVGRLDSQQRHKGHDQLLESLVHILKELPDAQLLIAGTGDDRLRLENKALALGVSENVVFLGWVSDAELLWLYRESSVFVMPSDGDGFGLVFLEAMMNGLPCVGLKDGAAGEIFDHRVSGVLVERNDPLEMAHDLSEILLKRVWRNELGEAALVRYQEKFAAKHYSKRLRSILRNFVEESAQ